MAPVRNERLVVTTDAVVEGVHFSRAYSSPADIGHKALAVNLSDLAAMARDAPLGPCSRWCCPARGWWRTSKIWWTDWRPSRDATGSSVVGGNITPHRWPAGRGRDGRRRSRTEAMVDARRREGGSTRFTSSGAIGGAAAGLEMLQRDQDESRDQAIGDQRTASRVIDARSRECAWASRSVAGTSRDGGDGFERRPRRCAAAGRGGKRRRRADRRAMRCRSIRARASGGRRAGVDPVNAAVQAATTTSCCSRCRRSAAARCGRCARHVTGAAADEDRRVYEGPARARGRARRERRTRYRRVSNTLRIAEAYWKRAIATLMLSPRSSCLRTRFKRATRDPKPSVPTITESHRAAAGRRAPAVHGDGVLQGRDDGVGRRRAHRHRGGRSGDPARRQRRPRRDAEPAIQRRVDGDGHRSWRCADAASTSICGAARKRCSSDGARCG